MKPSSKKKKSIFDPIVFSNKNIANRNLIEAIKEAKQRDPQKYLNLGEVKLADPKELRF